MTHRSSEHTRRTLLAASAAAIATLGLGRLIKTDPAEAAAYLVHPEGSGSVSGAPHLPPGFRDTFTSRYVEANGIRTAIASWETSNGWEMRYSMRRAGRFRSLPIKLETCSSTSGRATVTRAGTVRDDKATM